MTVWKWLERLMEAVATLALVVVLCVVLLQVFYRYVLNNPLGASQEISVFAMMLFVMLGTAISFKRREHIAVSFFTDLLPGWLRKLSAIVASLISLSFMAMLCYQSWMLSKRAMMQISPTTGIPVGVIVLFVTVGSGLSFIYLFSGLLRSPAESPSAQDTAADSMHSL